MKGDYSRFTHDPVKRYTRVRKPQGRVNTDADWNEQVEIALRRVRVEAKDVIGLCGVPRSSDGFRIGLDLYGVGSVPGVVDWAVGANGLILRRSLVDSESWKAIASPGEVRSQLLIDVCPLPGDGNVAWVVGTHGTILFTDDGGATWVQQEVPVEAADVDLYAVHFPGGAAGAVGWAVGARGALLRTDDWGQHWQVVENLPFPDDLKPALSGICTAEDIVCVVGGNATILLSDVAGSEWIPAQTPFTETPEEAPDLFGVAATGLETPGLCAVGQNGTILLASVAAPLDVEFDGPISLDGLAGETLWDVAGSIGIPSAAIVGEAGVFVTWDESSGFELKAPPTALNLYDVAYADRELRVVGQDGVILESADQGGEWIPWEDLPISAGRIYVDGVLCESDDHTLYSQQPSLPDPPMDPETGRVDLAYLDVWERPVSEIGDPSLVDEALGVPTSDRVQTVWQVKLTRLPDLDLTLEQFRPALYLPTSPGTAQLSTQVAASEQSTDPCSMVAGGGYCGLENRLYRVEIHNPGHPYRWRRSTGDTGTAIVFIEVTDDGRTIVTAPATPSEGPPWRVGQAVEVFSDQTDVPGGSGALARIDAVDEAGDPYRLTLDRDLSALQFDSSLRLHRIATFKWSRDNGSVAYEVTAFDPVDKKKLTLADLGRDRVTSVKVGDLVEFVDDDTELASMPGTIARVASEGINEASREVTLSEAVTPSRPGRHPRLIRWDHAGLADAELAAGAVPIIEGGWIDMESGIQIRFETGGEYRPGDYWTFTARTAKGTVEELSAALPHGIKHHVCPLALMRWNAGTATIVDRRALFDPLTADRIRFFHVGGTGQEVMPGPTGVLTKLSKPLQVGVTDGRWPILGAKVRFEAADGELRPAGAEDGTSPEIVIPTNDAGIAACEWFLDSNAAGTQEVIATLLTPEETPMDGVPPLAFHANLSVAGEVFAALRYICGNGQAGASGDLLPVSLTVGVEDHLGRPVQNSVPVRFTIVDYSAEAGGALEVPEWPMDESGRVVVNSSAGIAGVYWKLGAYNFPQHVIAELLDDAGAPTAALPIHFYATELAAGPATPQPDCSVSLVKCGGTEIAPGTVVSPGVFLDQGLTVEFGQEVDPETVDRFSFLVELEIAEGGAASSDSAVYAFEVSRILGTVAADELSATFTPSENIWPMLLNVPAAYYDQCLCCRVTLKGSQIKLADDGPFAGNGFPGTDYESRFLIGPPPPD